MDRIKVCFVSLHSYSLFNEATRFAFGGAEVRGWLLGRGLARSPLCSVSFIVQDHGQRSKSERYGDVEVWHHPAYRTPQTLVDRLRGRIADRLKTTDRFPYVRLKTWHPLHLVIFVLWGLLRTFEKLMSSLRGGLHIDDYKIPCERYQIYDRVDADVYCIFGVSNLSAELARFCEVRGKKLVLFCASDRDLSESYYAGSTERNPRAPGIGHLCHFAITHATHLVTQTTAQAELLRERFSRPSITIRNPIDLNDVSEKKPHGSSVRKKVLWIGKSDDVKRPERLIELALTAPEFEFLAVMNRSNAAKHDAILAACPANVTIVEHVPFDEIESCFAGAFALVNTSRFEGFPNTFLQAGKYGVPVLSLSVDPDGFLENHKCGVIAHDNLKELLRALRELADDRKLHDEMKRNIRRYVEKNHRLEDKVQQLENWLYGRCRQSSDSLCHSTKPDDGSDRKASLDAA